MRGSRRASTDHDRDRAGDDPQLTIGAVVIARKGSGVCPSVGILCVENLRGLHPEDVTMPGRHIEIETARLQVFSIAIVAGIAEQILESPLSAVEVGERETDATLTLVRGVIHGDEQALAIRFLPHAGDESVG